MKLILPAEECQQREFEKPKGKLDFVYKIAELVDSPKKCGQWENPGLSYTSENPVNSLASKVKVGPKW